MYPLLGIAMLGLSFPGFSTPVSAGFVGLDANGDFTCEPPDMRWTAGDGDVGSLHSIRLYFDDLPPAFAWGCIFCVMQKSRIGEWSWTFTWPGGGWRNEDVCDSDSDIPCIWSGAPYILQNPDSKCWLVGAFDGSYTAPIGTYPFTVGVLEYQVAEEGEIQWLIDAPNTAVLSTGWETYTFGDPGEVCTGPAATKATSWGSVKAFFR